MRDDLVAKLRAIKVPTKEEVLARGSFQSGNYIVMRNIQYYALALKALRGACAADKNSIQPEDFGLVRPLTFEETIRARVEDYERVANPDGSERKLGERRRLFETYLHTASAVVNKGGTTKFKIVPLSEHFVTLGEDFRDAIILTSYDDFSDYEELDFAAAGIKYNDRLSREAILEHPAWRACVQDVELLRTYRDIVFEVCEDPGEAMGFFVARFITTNPLWPLFVGGFIGGSDANGRGTLRDNIGFLRVTRGDEE